MQMAACDEKNLTLLAATNNAGKLVEIQQILAPYFAQVLSAKQVGVQLDVDEDADTFMGNARKKALEFCRATHMPAVADDSGLCIDALNGEPGVYSARYMGDGHTDAQRTQFVLEKMRGVPDEKRTARFVSAAVIVFPDGRVCSAIGTCEGSIVHAPVGENGFGYDPIFVPAGQTRTFAQMSDDEKNAISHRGRAMRLLAEKLMHNQMDDATEEL